MAYDVELANRLRESLAGESDVSERAMFGGLAFLVNGHLAVSASSHGGILLRIDPANATALLAEPDVEAFVMRGRALNGWLRVAPPALEDDEAFTTWVARGVSYARSLPPKG
jgi:TfoX/Sxy family transcriptional regulator of competence genes